VVHVKKKKGAKPQCDWLATSQLQSQGYDWLATSQLQSKDCDWFWENPVTTALTNLASSQLQKINARKTDHK